MNGFIELRYAKRFGFWEMDVTYVIMWALRGLHACPCSTYTILP